MESITIAGGGLAGCLMLAALKHRWPNLDVILYEKSPTLSHHQTWSFHHEDVPAECWPWLTPLISKSWPGYDVFFPLFQRRFNSGYYSIRAEDLAAKMMQKYSQFIRFNSSAELNSNTIITTGWPHLPRTENFGFQKFVGLDLKLKNSHGLTQPILKDVRWPQTDGYRFFYVLPWSETELLIEDTYYSNSSDLNKAQIKAEILKYAALQNWSVESVVREEAGSLPLDLSPSKPVDLFPLALGAAAGLAHPVTGYTLPVVLQQISTILKCPQADLNLWRQQLKLKNNKIRRPYSYFCFLNRMLFRAAQPDQRYEILQRFYRLPEALISRFYVGQTSVMDQFRILLGRPPVPLLRAISQLRYSTNTPK